jgi:hypothetical protein
VNDAKPPELTKALRTLFVDSQQTSFANQFLRRAVAYLTADSEAVTSFFSDSGSFVKADPFPYLACAVDNGFVWAVQVFARRIY